MLRYENEAHFVVRISLENNYTVFASAKYDKETTKYTVSYEIKCDTDDIKLEAGKFEVESDMQNIRRLILKDVADRHHSGEFSKIIEQYEYIVKCFHIADDAIKKLEESDDEYVEVLLD